VIPTPPPPPDRVVVDGQLPGVGAVAIVVALAALAAWFAPEIALIASLQDRADRNIGQRAYVSCEPPAEFEQLHIVVTKNEGRIAASCMYIGSKGTYTRRSVRQADAQ
jgi:hypothetical protein